MKNKSINMPLGMINALIARKIGDTISYRKNKNGDLIVKIKLNKYGISYLRKLKIL
jgi:hypothetical protein